MHDLESVNPEKGKRRCRDGIIRHCRRSAPERGVLDVAAMVVPITALSAAMICAGATPGQTSWRLISWSMLHATATTAQLYLWRLAFPNRPWNRATAITVVAFVLLRLPSMLFAPAELSDSESAQTTAEYRWLSVVFYLFLFIGTYVVIPRFASADAAAPAAPVPQDASKPVVARCNTGMSISAAVICLYGLLTRTLWTVGISIGLVSPLTLLVWFAGLSWDARKGHAPTPRHWSYLVTLTFFMVALPTGLSTVTYSLVYQLRGSDILQIFAVYSAQLIVALLFRVWRAVGIVAAGGYSASLPANFYFTWVAKLFLDFCFLQIKPLSGAFFSFLLLSSGRDIVTGGFLSWDLLRMARQRNAAWPPERPLASVVRAFHRGEQSLMADLLSTFCVLVAIVAEFLISDVLHWTQPTITVAIPREEVGMAILGYTVLLLSHFGTTWIVRSIHKHKLSLARAAELNFDRTDSADETTVNPMHAAHARSPEGAANGGAQSRRKRLGSVVELDWNFDNSMAAFWRRNLKSHLVLAPTAVFLVLDYIVFFNSTILEAADSGAD